MEYSILRNDTATYAVDWDIVYRLVKSYHVAVARDLYSKVVSTSNVTWYNPASWSSPDIRSLDVDWDQVRSKSIQAADEDFARLAERGTRSVPDMYKRLEWMVADTAKRTSDFVDEIGAIQSDNMARMNAAVDRYGTWIEIAKFFRDTSADGLMIGASILTGGAGVAVLGTGSMLKGWAKYEDTNNAGAAVLTGAGAFTFGAFKVGGTTLNRSETIVVTVLQAQWEAGIALTEGKSLGQAATAGAASVAMKVSDSAVDRFFKSDTATKMIKRAVAPLTITVVTEKGVENASAKLAGKVVTKAAQAGVRAGEKAVVKAIGKASASPKSGTQTSPKTESLLEHATPSNDALLRIAIVNMDKGIGRGL
jgi:hypothetical protein